MSPPVPGLVLAVANQKGGVAKTTTAIALAGLMAGQGVRVLLVDLDPHASLTSYAGLDPDAVGHSVYELFDGDDGEALARATPWPGIDLAPAAPRLATLDRRLSDGQGLGLVLSRWLRRRRGEYHGVLLDCAPMLGILMVNALAACDRVLVPAQTEFLSLNGVRRMARTLAMLERSRGRPLPWLVVPTMFDRRTRASPQSLRALREEFGERVWHGVIPVDTRLRDASQAGVPPAQLAPCGRAVVAYRELLDTVIEPEAAAAATQ